MQLQTFLKLRTQGDFDVNPRKARRVPSNNSHVCGKPKGRFGMGAGGGGWGLGFLLIVCPLQTQLLKHMSAPGTKWEARPTSGPRCSQGASRCTTYSHLNFPSCPCVVGETPSTNPYSEENAHRGSHCRPFACWVPLPVCEPSLVPCLLNLTGPEAWVAQCREFSCHNSLVVVKSNYMFQMMKSTVIKSWHSHQGDRCIQSHGF